MSLRPDPTDPAGMTPGQRLEEIASILARGVLRVQRRDTSPLNVPREHLDSAFPRLELSDHDRPHDVAGERPEKGGDMQC